MLGDRFECACGTWRLWLGPVLSFWGSFLGPGHARECAHCSVSWNPEKTVPTASTTVVRGEILCHSNSTLSKQIWQSYTSRDFYFTVLVKLYHRLGVWFIDYCIYRTWEISLSFYIKRDYKCTARTRKIYSILSTRSEWYLVQSLKRRHKWGVWSVGLLSIVETINEPEHRRWVIERNSIW